MTGSDRYHTYNVNYLHNDFLLFILNVQFKNQHTPYIQDNWFLINYYDMKRIISQLNISIKGNNHEYDEQTNIYK